MTIYQAQCCEQQQHAKQTPINPALIMHSQSVAVIICYRSTWALLCLFMSDALAYQIIAQVLHHQVAVCWLHTLIVDAND